jgi:hypothetical protein
MADRHPLTALLVTAVVLALLTACGPESCGTRDVSRYKPGGIVEHCENGVWVSER